MRQLDDQQLILYLYGEAEDPEAIRRRLAASSADRERLDALQALMATVSRAAVPEPPADYERRLWQRLQPRLAAAAPWWRRLWTWLRGGSRPLPRLALAAAALLVATVAFLAGRAFEPGDRPPSATLDRERILLVAVGRHLERSQLLLIELANRQPGEGGDLALGDERDTAAALVGDNRLYRQAASRAGRGDLAAVLDELERVLLDLAHSPEALAGDDLEGLRARIEGPGVLFKVRVLGGRVAHQLRSNQTPTPPRRPRGHRG